MSNHVSRRLTVLGIYPHPSFWSMGEGRGAPSFSLAPRGLAAAGHRVVIVLPARAAAPSVSASLSASGPPSSVASASSVSSASSAALRPRSTSSLPDADLEGVELVRHPGFPRGILEDARLGRLPRLLLRIETYARYRRVATRVARAVAGEIRPDVVVGYDEYGVPVARAVARGLGVPNVSRFFGTYLLPHLGNPLRLWYHFVPAIAYSTEAAYAVINDDGSGGDRVALRLGTPAERIRFWRNGVDRGLYRPDLAHDRAARARLRAACGLPGDGPLLFTMSRLVREKHVERIVRALPLVAAAHPGVALLVLGDGPEREALEAEARRLGMEAHVRFLGAVARAELPAYLNAGGVFVAASDRTNAANPSYEAMICGRPVVLLDTGRTRDLIEDGRTGVLVAAPDGLGPALVALLADPGRAEEMGAQARDWALAHLPTPEERQSLEVEIIEQAAREAWVAPSSQAKTTVRFP